ncbi:MAG: UDP-N-acetylmuramate dehydrogenase [Proteobacteria bacterium]|nr:UDP-N-acetylmuramate dehydrogenase [Pseudomonadota bacterium]
MTDKISNQYNLPQIRGSYRFDVDLSKTNWFGVGGKAQILFRPKDADDLIHFLKNKAANLPITILGVGSNVIIRDGGIDGVVIKLGGEFAKITHQNDIITIGAGCLCFNAALYSKINALSGLEFLTGIPGSIGGAVAMNAGCHGGDISGILISAKAVDFAGNVIELKNEDFGFKYRGTAIRKDIIFIEATFRGEISDVQIVAQKIEELTKKREESQPIRNKTGGSTFKNPQIAKAWELIDKAGCRGFAIGDAQMSQMHCNFMINNGEATAKDLINLGNEVKKRVKEKTGVTLEWEIKILGKD